ncbi:Uncharacterized conserved protein UCP033563 [Candidatus Magnetoovum chiemensis]|nr:Uncharacterized conserved protein UCP033563 [Candidatus Magnetoovum chiemensis]
MLTKVSPFKCLLYNPNKVPIKDVTAPPYDIIDQTLQDDLYKRNEYNIVRVDFGKEYPDDNEQNNKYTRSAMYMSQWIETGILEFTDKKSYFLYEVEYEIEDKKKVMRGIFAAVKLVNLGDGVYPHEMTSTRAKTDRLNLMYSCKANISPIFALYNNNEQTIRSLLDNITASSPYISYTENNSIKHRFWIIDKDDDISTITNSISGKEIFIADGHHRYETSLEYNRQTNSADNVLMYLVNIADGGLTILPTHRLIKNLPQNPLDLLKDYFEINSVSNFNDCKKVLKNLSPRSYGLYLRANKTFYVLKYKADNFSNKNGCHIDVIILHDLILDKLYNTSDLSYEMDAEKIIHIINDENNSFGAAFFLNPTTVEDVEKVSRLGIRMPRKSTYFYPKIPTGLVIKVF